MSRIRCVPFLLYRRSLYGAVLPVCRVVLLRRLTRDGQSICPVRCGSWQKSWPCYSGICRSDSLTRACPSWERGWRRLFDIRLEDLSPTCTRNGGNRVSNFSAASISIMVGRQIPEPKQLRRPSCVVISTLPYNTQGIAPTKAGRKYKNSKSVLLYADVV
jgi:hypothetical protein